MVRGRCPKRYLFWLVKEIDSMAIKPHTPTTAIGSLVARSVCSLGSQGAGAGRLDTELTILGYVEGVILT